MSNNVTEDKSKNKKKATIIIIISLVVALVAFALVYSLALKPQKEYDKALGYYSSQNYEDAMKTFESLNDYKDSKKYIEECKNKLVEQKYQKALSLMNDGSYEDAIILFEELGDYSDSKENIEKCKRLIDSKAENTKNDAVYSAYYQVIKKKILDEGEPKVTKDIGFKESSAYKVSDICFVKLIDFNNDGVEELVVAEFDEDDWTDEYEVYAYYDGTVHKVLDDQKFELRSQDLGYVSVELYKKDGKYFIYHWDNTGFPDNGYTLSFDGKKFSKDLTWYSKENGYYFNGKKIEENQYIETVPNFDINIAYGENHSTLDKYYYSTDDMDVYAFSYLKKSAAEKLANDTKDVINMLKESADRVANNK